MLTFEHVLILGSVLVISCFVWMSFMMNSSAKSTELSLGDMVCSPRRRNRRGRKAKQKNGATSSQSKPAPNQTSNPKQKRTRLDGSEACVEMNVEETLPKEESMETDDVPRCENQSAQVQSHQEEIESKKEKVQIVTNSKMDSSPSRKDFSHPIYKQMSLRNGSVNRMSKVELQKALQDLGLNRLGSADVLKRRLKHHHSKESLQMAGLSSDVPIRFDYLCVIDVEATCLEINPVDYVHEIIEFPIVLLNTKTLQIEDTFDEFCKPVINPQLSPFCSQLTHISQKMVDKAAEFPTVLEKAERWMRQKGLGTKHSFAITTDCSLDMDLYLKLQCLVSEIPYPAYAKEWINISKVFANLYRTKRLPLRAMLDSTGLVFMGQPHRGIDDAKNIARIALQLIEDGAEMRCNEKLTPS